MALTYGQRLNFNGGSQFHNPNRRIQGGGTPLNLPGSNSNRRKPIRTSGGSGPQSTRLGLLGHDLGIAPVPGGGRPNNFGGSPGFAGSSHGFGGSSQGFGGGGFHSASLTAGK